MLAVYLEEIFNVGDQLEYVHVEKCNIKTDIK